MSDRYSIYPASPRQDASLEPQPSTPPARKGTETVRDFIHTQLLEPSSLPYYPPDRSPTHRIPERSHDQAAWIPFACFSHSQIAQARNVCSSLHKYLPTHRQSCSEQTEIRDYTGQCAHLRRAHLLGELFFRTETAKRQLIFNHEMCKRHSSQRRAVQAEVQSWKLCNTALSLIYQRSTTAVSERR
jgi:hypothetical protein